MSLTWCVVRYVHCGDPMVAFHLVQVTKKDNNNINDHNNNNNNNNNTNNNNNNLFL